MAVRDLNADLPNNTFYVNMADLESEGYCSSNDLSPLAVTTQVIAANTPKIAGLRNGSMVNTMAANDHAIQNHLYAIQKLPLFAKNVTDEIAAQQG